MLICEGNEDEKCESKERVKCEEEEEEYLLAQAFHCVAKIRASTLLRKANEEQEDDLISGLPDCLIEHILSFLPSTKYAIRTGILSKRWLNQWTRVPILIFNCKLDGMIPQNFPNFIDDSLNLYSCSKINKFVIDFKYSFEVGRKLTEWIRFGVERNVKELILNCLHLYPEDYKDFKLPQLIFNNVFLVKLKICSCPFMAEKGKVNWASLKALHINFILLPHEGLKNVLSGSPVIEYLEINNCSGFGGYLIASKSLKTFRMVQSGQYTSAIEISCPNLEKLEMLGEMRLECFKVKDLLSSVSATLNFEICAPCNFIFSFSGRLKFLTELVKELLLQVQHVEELKPGPWILKIIGHEVRDVEYISSLLRGM